MHAQSAAAHGADGSSLAARDLLLLVVINLIWGFNLIASKVGVSEFPPLLFTVLRFGILSVCLVPFLRWYPGQGRNLVLAGLLTGGLSFALLFVGLRISGDASTVAIATQLGVPFSTLLSVWLLGEHIRWRRVLGIALAFGGVVIIGFDPRVFSYWQGLALVIAAVFVGSLGVIYIKRLRDVSAIGVQAWVSTISWPVLLVLSLTLESNHIAAIQNASLSTWGAILYTVFCASLIGHTGWYYLIGRYPVTSVAPLTLLSPIFGILFGVTLLNDQLTGRMLIGGAITLLGVFVVVMRERRLVDTGT